MIDGVKIRLLGPQQERVRANALIDWRPNGTGVNDQPRFRGTWEGFTFTGNELRCWAMRGSFHKFHEGGSNRGDFYLSEFVPSATEVCTRLGIASNVQVCNVEAGVNIIPPIPTRDVLRSIVLHKVSTEPVQMKGAGQGHGITFDYSTHRLKIYDKEDQFPEGGELLRFEVAARKMAAVGASGVKVLSDLFEPSAWQALASIALRRFDELLILNPGIPLEALNERDRDLVSNATRHDYWNGLTRQRRCDNRRRLERINSEHGTLNLKAELRQRIADKFAALVDMEERTFCPTVEVEQGTAATRTDRPTVQQHAEVPTQPRKRTDRPLVIKGQNVRVEVLGEGEDRQGLGKAPNVPAEAFGLPAEVVSVASSTIDPHRVENEAPTEFLKSIKRAAESDGIPGPPCATCGRPTGSKSKRSKFCARTFYGEKAAKKCRNADSNARHNPKTHRDRSIANIMRGGVLFDQSPFLRPAHQPPART